MACLEHECVKCGWSRFDNSSGPDRCPKCGARVVTTFDEDPADDEPDYSGDPEADNEDI